VGDAPGQGADGLHLLGLPQGRFQAFGFPLRLLASGDVQEHGPGAHHFSVQAGFGQGVKQGVDDLAVRAMKLRSSAVNPLSRARRYPPRSISSRRDSSV
jgi:hypothetical protein